MSDWIPIGEPDIPLLSQDAKMVLSVLQNNEQFRISQIISQVRIGFNRVTDAIYEVRKMEAIRMAKLTNQQRAAIYQAHKDGVSQNELARQYGVTKGAISQLCAKLAKAEEEIMQPAAEDKQKPGIINPEFDAAVDEMIEESKSADAAEKSANAKPEKLPGVVCRAIDAGFHDLADKIDKCRSQIEDLEAMIAEYEKDITALKAWREEHA